MLIGSCAPAVVAGLTCPASHFLRDGRFWPAKGARQLVVKDRALAVSLAAKSFTDQGEIRVVHVPTGEVVFRKPPRRTEWNSEE